MNLRSWCVLGLVLAPTGFNAGTIVAQKPSLPLPLPTGTSIVQTLSTSNAERESVHLVQESSPRSIRWSWSLVEIHETGDTVRREYRYTELAADINYSGRLWFFHSTKGPEEHPGYTMHAISRATYRKLRATGSDSFQVMLIEARKGLPGFSALGLGGDGVPIRWRGILRLGSPDPQPFPLLLNGQRIEVPALHLRGRFEARGRIWEPEMWVLADTTYPLLLKVTRAHEASDNVLQTVRVDTRSSLPELERGLVSTCRVELPGIYFAFNSAMLDSASDRTLASVADILKRHADWRVTLEGHTDSIGTASANKVLSERRVAAVKERLARRYGIDTGRIRTHGFGRERPREPNGSIEGRARNRRVELVRECGRE
jgi:outer membrane protein OmpA-like peptidoglycan-associated protein